MSRILCAWELGANLGHLGQLQPVARALERMGHTILRARPPALLMKRLPTTAQIPLDDVIDAIDFGAVAAWQRIFDAARPDCVLLNAAPRASVAAKARGLHRFVVSDGYWLPERSRHHDLLWGDTAFFATFPELDHHGPRPGATYFGPLYMDDAGEPPAWTGTDRPRVVAYLRAQWKPLLPLAQALWEKGTNTVFFVPDADDTLLDALRAIGAQAQRTPLRLFAPGAAPDLAICHAGHGTVAASLVAGIPLLLAPLYAEQDLTARNVERLGAGLRVGSDTPAEMLGRVLDQLLDNSACRAAAALFRATHADYKPGAAAARISGSIDQTLRDLQPTVTSPSEWRRSVSEKKQSSLQTQSEISE